jgi:hypothetical protein
MTIAVSQVHNTNGLGGSSPLTDSFSTLPTAGHAVIVIIDSDIGGTAMTITGVTDNQTGNTYTKVVGAYDSYTGMYTDAEIWWCSSIGTPTGTFTVHAAFSGSMLGGNCSLALVEASGITTVDKTGTSAPGTAVATITATASGANSAANALVIGGTSTNYYGAPNSVTTPPTTGYTSIYAVTSGIASSFGYKIVTAVETSAVTVSWGGTNICSGVIATFKGSGGGSPVNSGFFSFL